MLQSWVGVEGQEMGALGLPRGPRGADGSCRGWGWETGDLGLRSTASLTQGEEFPRFNLLDGDYS